MTQQGSAEWHAERSGRITCSRFADVIDRTAKGERKAGGRDYLIRLALERISGKSTPVFETWQMRQGTEREPSARRIYEYRHGVTVEPCGFVVHPDYPNVGGSPDGQIDESVGVDRFRVGGLELKCPELEQHLENLSAVEAGELPEKYKAQVQGCLWVCGADWWDWCSFNPDFPPHLEFCELRVERDDEYILMLEREVCLFEAEVQELVDRLMQMNGGPVAAPERMRDLDFDSEEYSRLAFDFAANDKSLNDDFDIDSWIYQRSELREGVAYHILNQRSSGETMVVLADLVWQQENRIQ